MLVRVRNLGCARNAPRIGETWIATVRLPIHMLACWVGRSGNMFDAPDSPGLLPVRVRRPFGERSKTQLQRPLLLDENAAAMDNGDFELVEGPSHTIELSCFSLSFHSASGAYCAMEERYRRHQTRGFVASLGTWIYVLLTVWQGCYFVVDAWRFTNRSGMRRGGRWFACVCVCGAFSCDCAVPSTMPRNRTCPAAKSSRFPTTSKRSRRAGWTGSSGTASSTALPPYSSCLWGGVAGGPQSRVPRPRRW